MNENKAYRYAIQCTILADKVIEGLIALSHKNEGNNENIFKDLAEFRFLIKKFKEAYNEKATEPV